MITRYRTSPFSHPFSGLVNSLLNQDISQTWGHDDVASDRPKVNITEGPAGYSLEMLVPGYSKEEIKISVEDGSLKVLGSKTSKEVQEGDRFLRREFRANSFERQFSLPETVDSDAIKAEVEHGVLRLQLPLFEPAKPKVREIAIG